MKKIVILISFLLLGCAVKITKCPDHKWVSNEELNVVDYEYFYDVNDEIMRVYDKRTHKFIGFLLPDTQPHP